MRIGITCYPTYGGSGVVATELGIELAAMGHEVHFISYSQPFRLSGRDDGIFYHEVPVSSYPLFEFPPYDLALASRMAEVAEFCNLDLLHVHYAIPHSVSALLARQMLAAKGRKLPFVTTLHEKHHSVEGDRCTENQQEQLEQSHWMKNHAEASHQRSNYSERDACEHSLDGAGNVEAHHQLEFRNRRDKVSFMIRTVGPNLPDGESS